MKPTIGRVVIYTPTEDERKAWRESSGGNKINEAEKLPAIVVAVWSETCINVKVDLDGPGQLWKTSINRGDGPGEWNWPVKE